MSILGWIVLGLIAGALAKLVMPGKDPGGFLVTLLLGVVGAFIGGFLGSWIFGVGVSQFWSLSTWLLAILGSIIVLAVYRAVAGGKPARS